MQQTERFDPHRLSKENRAIWLAGGGSLQPVELTAHDAEAVAYLLNLFGDGVPSEIRAAIRRLDPDSLAVEQRRALLADHAASRQGEQ